MGKWGWENWLEAAVIALDALVVLGAPFIVGRIPNTSTVLEWLVAVASALLIHVLVKLYLLEHRIEQTKSGIITGVEQHLGRRIYSFEIDNDLMKYSGMAKHLLARHSGLERVMHPWLLKKAEVIVERQKFIEYFADESEAAGKLDEQARVGVLTNVLINAKDNVYACTFIDPYHLEMFWENPSTDEYILAHRDVLQRKLSIDIKRIFIIPGNLPKETRQTLVDLGRRFLDCGMTHNYWLPEEDARGAFDKQKNKNIKFPDRGFFLADGKLSGKDGLAFLSKGLPRYEAPNDNAADRDSPRENRPYFLFTGERETGPVKETLA